MSRASIVLFLASVLPFLSASSAAAAPAAPKFYVVVRGVDEGQGVKSEIVEEAKALFVAELGRRPELTLTPPAELHEVVGKDGPTDTEAFKAALRAHKLRAIELTLRILEVTRALDPPPAGKPFRVLKRGIRLSVFGTTMPDKVMAIGGDGDALIATEVKKNDDVEREGKSLLADATKAAITQAVDMTVTKLSLPPPKDPKPKKPAKR